MKTWSFYYFPLCNFERVEEVNTWDCTPRESITTLQTAYNARQSACNAIKGVTKKGELLKCFAYCRRMRLGNIYCQIKKTCIRNIKDKS